MTLPLSQLSALLMLMAETGQATNTVLKDRYGSAIDGQLRRTLNEAKLVESHRHGRGFEHVLTDSGWARAAEALREGVPVPSRAGTVAARVLLAWLGATVRRGERSLAELFAPDEVSASTAPATEGATAVLGHHEDAEGRVRAAYAALAARPGEWVRLAVLREHLADLPRDAVDAALVQLNRADGILIPEGNQKTLTPGDRAAAIVIGNQDKHLLAIGA
ncbi:hypothetical protein [Nonomuraea soli]|uniref:Uncharacterized protein n=1 Tax=Nonomuraea soli TaxID=1032476 RepID=A0A7W0CDS1_9ACTN|nr:hypothetical protein [Nonomuraea soli]MBA2889261.1 hypothetical protein [Nonomuraea soli]